jgi:hypothetical protein
MQPISSDERWHFRQDVSWQAIRNDADLYLESHRQFCLSQDDKTETDIALGVRKFLLSKRETEYRDGPFMNFLRFESHRIPIKYNPEQHMYNFIGEKKSSEIMLDFEMMLSAQVTFARLNYAMDALRIRAAPSCGGGSQSSEYASILDFNSKVSKFTEKLIAVNDGDDCEDIIIPNLDHIMHDKPKENLQKPLGYK